MFKCSSLPVKCSTVPLNRFPDVGYIFNLFRTARFNISLCGHQREATLAKVQKSVFRKDWFDQLSCENVSLTERSQILNDI